MKIIKAGYEIMDKPKNPFRKGSCIWKLFEGNWEGKTAEEIAMAIGCSTRYVYLQMERIASKTGYRILYKKTRGDTSHKNIGWSNLHQWYVNRKGKGNCDTCWNFNCPVLAKRKAVTWKNCGGYLPEPEEVEV